jgi:TolA-binding protein
LTQLQKQLDSLKKVDVTSLDEFKQQIEVMRDKLTKEIQQQLQQQQQQRQQQREAFDRGHNGMTKEPMQSPEGVPPLIDVQHSSTDHNSKELHPRLVTFIFVSQNQNQNQNHSSFP